MSAGQVLNSHRQPILDEICSWEWSMPDGTASLASVYESAFPADRPAIVDDRQGISDEIVSAE